MIPPIKHTCCGTPCFMEWDRDQEQYPCWGDISCVDSSLVEYEDGSNDEVRTGACQGHWWVYPSCDNTKYIKYTEKNDI